MKKSVTLMILVVLVSILMAGCNIKTIGAQEYYVQIKGEGKKEQGSRYYRLNGYNSDGEEKEITFMSMKAENGGKLREDAYLRIFAKPKDKKAKQMNEVISYEEVKAEEIPTKAKEKLGIQ